MAAKRVDKARTLLALDWKQAKAFLEDWLGSYAFGAEITGAQRDQLIAVLPESRDDVTDLIIRYAVKDDQRWSEALVTAATHPSVEAARRAVRRLGEWHDVDSLVRVAQQVLRPEVKVCLDQAIVGLTPVERKRFAKTLGQSAPDTGHQATAAELRSLFVDRAEVWHYGRKHVGKKTKPRAIDVPTRRLAVFELAEPSTRSIAKPFTVSGERAEVFTVRTTRLLDFGAPSASWDAPLKVSASLSGLTLGDDGHREALAARRADLQEALLDAADESGPVSLEHLGLTKAGSVWVCGDYGQGTVRLHVGRDAKGVATALILETDFGPEQ